MAIPEALLLSHHNMLIRSLNLSMEIQLTE